MSLIDEIRQSLADHAGRFGPSPTLLAKVKTVNSSDKTVDLVDDDGLEIPGVRIKPVLDGSEGLTLFPKVDSWAIAVRVEDSEDWMLIASGEVDKWQLSIGQTLIEQTAQGLQIKKGADSLKDVLQMIIEATQQIVVLVGNGPDYAKLGQALVKLNNILR